MSFTLFYIKAYFFGYEGVLGLVCVLGHLRRTCVFWGCVSSCDVVMRNRAEKDAVRWCHLTHQVIAGGISS